MRSIINEREYNAAKDFNRMLKANGNDVLIEQLRDIAFDGICIKCGSVVGDDQCYCDRDD